MAAPVVLLGSFAVVVVVLLSILGAVERRGRFAFVLGIIAFIAVHSASGTPATAGTILAVLGLAAAVAATVPLLQESV